MLENIVASVAVFGVNGVYGDKWWSGAESAR